VLGRTIDLGHGRRAVTIGYSIAAAILVLRAASLGSPWLAITANALGALATPLFIPGIGRHCTTWPKPRPATLRFNMVTEGGWDIGSFAGFLTAAAFYASGWSLSVCILQGLPAVAAGHMASAALFGRTERLAQVPIAPIGSTSVGAP